VQRLQLAAVRNRNNETGAAELVCVVNSMRQQNEPLDERSARVEVSSLNAATVRARGYPMRQRSIYRFPIKLATFTWLVRMPGVSGRAEVNDVVVATLHNAMRR